MHAGPVVIAPGGVLVPNEGLCGAHQVHWCGRCGALRLRSGPWLLPTPAGWSHGPERDGERSGGLPDAG
jgi:hypothetical protein